MTVEMHEIPDSHNIHSVGHDDANNELHIRFKRYDKETKAQVPGALYCYRHIGGDSLAHHVDHIRNAESPTGHFTKHIKNNDDIAYRKSES